MTFGTGPQALATLFEDEWEPTRNGRPDIPDVTTDPDREFGIIVTDDNRAVKQHQGVHDLIHCYHPESAPVDTQDKGHVEQGVVETVQVDIVLGDRNDPTTGERLSSRRRMVGDRDDPGFQFNNSGPYPGIFGEAKHILETKRRGLAEWDVASHNVLTMALDNSNATVKINVELEHVAINTADV